MALADLDAFTAALKNPQEGVSLGFGTTLTGVSLGRPADCWVPQAPAGVAPTTAVVPTRTTAGAIGQQNGSGTLAILGARFNATSPSVVIIADRLSHQGGLSGTTTGAQTTNLPTAALTRYTGGDGVMIGLTIYSQVGTTGTTVTASYTNQAGTSGRTTPAVAFGATSFREGGRLILLPLQAGDTGVQAVASVTLAASTATAGNFGVTLFKPLVAVLAQDQSGVVASDFITGSMGGGIPEVVDDACLYPIVIGIAAVQSGAGAILTTEH